MTSKYETFSMPFAFLLIAPTRCIIQLSKLGMGMLIACRSNFQTQNRTEAYQAMLHPSCGCVLKSIADTYIRTIKKTALRSSNFR